MGSSLLIQNLEVEGDGSLRVVEVIRYARLSTHRRPGFRFWINLGVVSHWEPGTDDTKTRLSKYQSFLAGSCMAKRMHALRGDDHGFENK